MIARAAILSLVLLLAGAPGLTRTVPRPALPNDNRIAAGVLEAGVLTLKLEATHTMWHPDGDSLAGMEVAAFAEEGEAPRVPGPLIRVPRGTEIRASVRNSLERDTIAFHMPSFVAGAEPDSTFIPPGEVREIRVRAEQPGNFIYRATSNDVFSRALQLHQLLVGALVVDSSASAAPPRDRIFAIVVLTDSLEADGITVPERSVFAINGRSWPHTERITATVGDTLRWRVINTTVDVHPMHLHGVYFRVDESGNAVVAQRSQRAEPRWVVTERMSTHATMSMMWVPERPGNWLFHCHFQVHMVPGKLRGSVPPTHGPHALTGMGGLVLGITAQPRKGATVAEPPRGRRQLRLVAVRDEGFPDTAPSLRFVLEEHGTGRREAGTGFSPTISLRRGEPVSITVVNQLSEPTAVHWHGIELESYYDGVAGFGGSPQRVTPLIAPRDSFEARFTPPRAGTFIYHSHVDEVRQHRAGLVGALIVRDPVASDSTNESIVFIKSARAGPATRPTLEINGRSNPDTTALRLGLRYRLRIIHMAVANPSAALSLTAQPDSIPAMMLDTLLLQWRLVAKDGADLPVGGSLTRAARQLIAMGETYDFEFTPSARGNLRLEIRAGGRGGRLLTRVPIRVE